MKVDNTCYICGGEINLTRETIETGWGDFRVSVNGLYVYKCVICGEVTMDAKTSMSLQVLCKENKGLKNKFKK